MRIFSLFLLSSLAFSQLAFSQVNIKFTPLPNGSIFDSALKAHGLRGLQIDMCNASTTAPRTLSLQQIAMQSTAPNLISPAAAASILNTAAKKSTWSQVAKIGMIVLQFTGPAGAIAGLVGKLSATTALIISSTASGIAAVGPQVVTIIQGQIPSTTPLLPQLTYPVTLAANTCVTDFEFVEYVKLKKGTVVPSVALIIQ